MTEQYRTIIVKRQNPAAIITLNRPECRNALSVELITEVEQALRALDDDSDVSAVVLTGSAQASRPGWT